MTHEADDNEYYDPNERFPCTYPKCNHEVKCDAMFCDYHVKLIERAEECVELLRRIADSKEYDHLPVNLNNARILITELNEARDVYVKAQKETKS